MDSQPIKKLLVAIASHVASMTSGVEAATAVAITCVGGQSFGTFLVYIANFDFQCRHQGMKLAFGEETEIFKVVGNHPPAELTSNDYDRFVKAALEAYEARDEAAAASGHNIVDDRQNYFLRHYTNFPVIRWGRTVYPLAVAITYTFIALGSIPFLFSSRIILQPEVSSIILEVLYIVAFLIVSVYSWLILRIERQVCYVAITENCVNNGMVGDFQKLRSLAAPYPNDAKEAIGNMRQVLPSLLTMESDTLLMPIMSIRTLVEDEPASWPLLLNDLRGILMASSLWLVPLEGSKIDWGDMLAIKRIIRLVPDCNFDLKSHLHKGWSMPVFGPPQKEE
ncbi:hypothetical protein AGABI1DRAFT_108363 [Agaricus bisporus var. burnettii JB137-S8]|uniref:Uncharacterized protein n=1 Tax=Agaricus bisporus var. burnettii (strain JB137-S8 / ATCC MYA-4627 / FGSC 10392) TaxID=597362 RepID=K5X289_AGABU|nr:uncharacterized protein AGABI1DRAFT_108363 [Agaricus bisporus var. burnettii JB137-S8]EKM77258.1 hypothetical protein AGABI1DRAFT_108363 [Agaricus bisporus var. burnettii JB137-S8]